MCVCVCVCLCVCVFVCVCVCVCVSRRERQGEVLVRVGGSLRVAAERGGSERGWGGRGAQADPLSLRLPLGREGSDRRLRLLHPAVRPGHSPESAHLQGQVSPQRSPPPAWPAEITDHQKVLRSSLSLSVSLSSTRTLMDGHRFRVFAVTFHPEREREFISGGWDNTIQVGRITLQTRIYYMKYFV